MFISFERHLDYKLYDDNRFLEELVSMKKDDKQCYGKLVSQNKGKENKFVRVSEQVDP